MKIPPKHLFISQCYGTALGSVVNFLLIQGVIAAKRPYLDGTLNDPTQQWSGRKPEIFFTASIIFGAISPSKFFDGQYHVLYWVRRILLSSSRSSSATGDVGAIHCSSRRRAALRRPS